MRRNILGTILVSSAFMGLVCGPPADQAVIRYSGGSMTLAEFRSELARRGPQVLVGEGSDTLDAARRDSLLLDFANGQADKLVMAHEGRHHVRGDTTNLHRELERTRRLKTLELLREREFSKLDLSDQKMNQIYEYLAEELKVRHILCRSKAKVEDLKRQIDAGADFAELARAESQDAFSREAGGELPWMTYGEAAGIDETAYHLQVGEVSEPVYSYRGWHLVKLEERRPRDRTGSDGNIEFFRRRFEDKLRTERWTQYQGALKERYGFQWDEAGLATALDIFKDHQRRQSAHLATVDSLRRAGAEVPPEVASFPRGPEPGPDERQIEVARAGDVVFRIDDVAEEIWSSTPTKLPITDKGPLMQWLEPRILDRLAASDAQTSGLFDDPEARRSVSDAVEFRFVERLYNAEVLAKGEPTEEEIRAFYEANRVHFYWRPDLDLAIFRTADAEVASRIEKALKEGKPAAVVQSDVQSDPSLEVTLRTGLKREFPEYPNLDSAIREQVPRDSVGTVTAPIPILGKLTIARIEARGERTPMTYEESRDMAQEACRLRKRETRMRSFLDSLRTALNVEIDETAVRSALAGGQP